MKPITLKNPIKNGDKSITEVTVRRPSAGEMRGFTLVDVNTLDINTLIKLIPRITTPPMTESQAELLAFDDISAIGLALVNGETAGNGVPPKP